MRQMLVTPDTDWFSDPRASLFLKAIFDQQMHICISSREIHRFPSNEFISID
jgi:hypothetical protein